MRRFAEGMTPEGVSADELCAAAACLGYVAAPGLQADILDCPGYLLRESVLRALRALELRGLALPSVDRRPEMAEPVRRLCALVCTPESVISVRCTVGVAAFAVKLYGDGAATAALRDDGRVFSFADAGSLAAELTESCCPERSEPCGADITVMYDELRYAGRLKKAFQEANAESFLAKCVLSDADGRLLTELLGGAEGGIRLMRWRRSGEGFRADMSDTLLVHEGRLLHLRSLSDGAVRVRGVSAERLRGRLGEYCGCGEAVRQ